MPTPKEMGLEGFFSKIVRDTALYKRSVLLLTCQGNSFGKISSQRLLRRNFDYTCLLRALGESRLWMRWRLRIWNIIPVDTPLSHKGI